MAGRLRLLPALRVAEAPCAAPSEVAQGKGWSVSQPPPARIGAGSREEEPTGTSPAEALAGFRKGEVAMCDSW